MSSSEVDEDEEDDEVDNYPWQQSINREEEKDGRQCHPHVTNAKVHVTSIIEEEYVIDLLLS